MTAETEAAAVLAANLRAAIKASGLTQREVAERVDMDPSALSKVLSGDRKVSSLELALICSATHADVLVMLGADPLHGPSYRQGYAEAQLHMRRHYEAGTLEEVFLPKVDADGDYTGCGAQHPEVSTAYCDLPTHPWPQTHHADLFWEDGSWSDAEGRHVATARTETEAAAVLAAHTLRDHGSGYEAGCWGCDWTPDAKWFERPKHVDQHYAHVAAALARAGVLRTETAAPDPLREAVAESFRPRRPGDLPQTKVPLRGTPTSTRTLAASRRDGPDHPWNGDEDGHNCADCPPLSIWRCDKPAHDRTIAATPPAPADGDADAD